MPFNVTKKRGKEVIVSSAWVPGKKYVLTICPNAFTNLLGESTDTVKVSFKYKEHANHGSLFQKAGDCNLTIANKVQQSPNGY